MNPSDRPDLVCTVSGDADVVLAFQYDLDVTDVEDGLAA